MVKVSPTEVDVILPPVPAVVISLPYLIVWLAFCAITIFPVFILDTANVSPTEAVVGNVNVIGDALLAK